MLTFSPKFAIKGFWLYLPATIRNSLRLATFQGPLLSSKLIKQWRADIAYFDVSNVAPQM